MESNQPLILDVRGNSLDDGPGIRTVIFFKGCPLSCSWCHNPESKSAGLEISYDGIECAGCNTCVETCPLGAVSRHNPAFIDRTACNLCLKCVEACPSGALAAAGRKMSVSEIITLIEKDIPFFKVSGGGVSLSGGEPTLHMQFLSSLLQALKSMDIHVLLETCGQFKTGDFLSLAYPFIDQVYFDLKLIDPALHKQYCGVDNRIILENFKVLHGKYRDGGTPVLPRLALIPGITDTPGNLRQTVEFLQACGADEIALLQYNPLWLNKAARLGKINQYDGPSSGTWMKKEQITASKEIFITAGIRISG